MIEVTELVPQTQADSAWKEILDVYFQEFMTFFYPEIAAEIDWAAGYEILDKELQSLTTEALIGKRLVDKLIRVRSLTGEEKFVLVHVEVQGNPEKEFEKRMFQYNYRLMDRYDKPIITLVVLTDTQAKWRPERYVMQVWEREVVSFRFWPVKLLDFSQQVDQLERTTNPFGMVVLAQLVAWATRDKPEDRLIQKFALTRRLYDQGLGRDAILNLYKFLDWLLTLPESLEIRYNNSIHELEEARSVSYITTAERIGIKKGYEQGIEQGIEKGIEKGKVEAQKAMAVKLLQKNIPLKEIAELTELSIPVLQSLQTELANDTH